MNWIKQAWTKISPTAKVVREFGFILAGFFLLFPLAANLAKIIFAHQKFHYWWGWPVLSVGALLLNLFMPRAVRLVYRVAMLFAHGVSWVVMRVVLSILFYLVLTPLSFALRALGKDLLDEKINARATSYWKRRPSPRPKADYERLF